MATLALVAFAGGAYAATQSSAPNLRQAFLKDVAQRLNVTPARLHSALMGAFDDQLSMAVAQGRLTRARAAALRQRAQRTGMVPLGALLRPGPGFAPGGPGLLGLLAPLLGRSAAAQGKSAAALKARLLARARRTIDRLAAAKLISSARAKQLLARLPARIDRLIRLIRHSKWFPFARPPLPSAPRPVPSAPAPSPPAPAPFPSAPRPVP